MTKKSFLVTIDTDQEGVADIVEAGGKHHLVLPTERGGIAVFDMGRFPRLAVEPVVSRDMPEAWAALRMIREAVETLGPIGAMPAEEHLDGPTLLHEAEAIVAGITKMKEPKPVLLDPEYDHLEFVVAIDPTKVRGIRFVDHDDLSPVGTLLLDDKFDSAEYDMLQVHRKLVR